MGNNLSPIDRIKSWFTSQPKKPVSEERSPLIQELEKVQAAAKKGKPPLKRHITPAPRPQITVESRERVGKEGRVKAFLSKISSTFKGFSLAKSLSRLKHTISSQAPRAAEGLGIGGPKIGGGEKAFHPTLEIAGRVFSKGMEIILDNPTEGVFRLSSSVPKKEKALKEVAEMARNGNVEGIGRVIEDLKEDVDLIAGIMKELVRNLEPSLINEEAVLMLVDSQAEGVTNDGVIAKLNEALRKLPAENRQLLIIIAQKLKQLADSHGEGTKMGYPNLAMTWGPNFFDICKDPGNVALYQKSITALIQYADTLES